jgi:hypothetical protein
MFPASKIRSAAVQVLTTASLAKVEGIFHEETMAISNRIAGAVASATSTHNSPSVASIRTMVPEEHTSMTTTLKHLKSHEPPPSTHMRSGLSIAPSMQTIIVNCVSIVNPQLAPIIGNKTEVVMACLEDSQASRPTNSKVIPAAIARPIATCVAIVHIVLPASKVRPATIQILTTTSLAEVEGIFHEEAMAICDWIVADTSAASTHNCPPVPGIGTVIPEKHPSMTSTLEHLQSHKTPPSTDVWPGLAIAPTM